MLCFCDGGATNLRVTNALYSLREKKERCKHSAKRLEKISPIIKRKKNKIKIKINK